MSKNEKKDATISSINDAKHRNHQIPEKSPEQLEQEAKMAAFMAAAPSRQEVQDFVDQVTSVRINDVYAAFNMVIAVIEKALVGNGILTDEQLKQAKEEIDKQIEAVKNAQKQAANTGNVESDAGEPEGVLKPVEKKSRRKTTKVSDTKKDDTESKPE